jgi:hypothetical protein
LSDYISRVLRCHENGRAKHLGVRRLDAAFGIVLGVISRRRAILVISLISKRRRAAAVQGTSHILMDSGRPKTTL